ncbi:membrane protein [Alcaligenes pakistanensis]|uniref:Membrane protein n=1 Tax=Alcaligenes pakistanensis TaxID=1482717 RepID=A0A8H9IL04_9BURK|nr:hypothetical protein [Alcaligenes pakistanensis]MBP6622664.1 hypothetical protein [Alcaligenes sp.]GHC45835.1 membrane protein [Alcaligenes pakistanensis]HCA16340.1 hypothetical protein [Alcaligenes faecalis]
MNDDLTPVPQGGGTNQLVNLRNLTLITYGLYILSLFGGITALVAIIINYVKRDEVKGTYLESHFDWQIRTFWWGLVGVCLSFLLMTILVGFVTIAIVGVWILYRLIKGLLAVNDGKPIA